MTQSGSAEESPNQEMLSAIDQIRQRHKYDLQMEETRIQAQPSIELVKEITDSTNSTEFLLLSLQRSFNMKPQQVQQLLTGQNLVLLRANEIGMPITDFTKPQSWYDYLAQDVIFQQMMKLFAQAFTKKQEVDVLLVLGAIKCGLYSKDETTTKLCLVLLKNIVDTLRQNGQANGMHPDDSFGAWFTKIVRQPDTSSLHNSVLQSAAECLETHPALTSEVAALFHSVFSARSLGLGKLPVILRAAYEDDIFMMYETMNSILTDLKRIDVVLCKQGLENSPLIQQALLDATDNHGDLALKLKTTNLLMEIWFEFPTIVSQPGQQHQGIGSLGRKESFHYVFQQGLQQRDKIFRLNLFAVGFALLDRLATKDNSETTAVYKTLIGGLIEHYKGNESQQKIDQVSTELILRGFKTVFIEHEDVPKDLLLEPFLDQLVANVKREQGQGIGGAEDHTMLRALELEFLIDIAKDHVRVLPEQTVHLLIEYLHSCEFQAPSLAHQLKISDLIGELVREHKESVIIVRLVEQQIVPHLLQSFNNIKRDEISKALQSPLAQHHSKKGRSPAKGSKGRKLLEKREKEFAVERRLTRFNIITLLDKLYEAFDGIMQQDNLVEQVRQAARSYKDNFKSTSAGIMHLMSKWEVLIDAFRQNQQLVPALYGGNAGQESSMVLALTEHEGDTAAEEQSRRAERRKKKELDWKNKVKEPSNPIALRAVEQYQAKKIKQIEQQNQIRLEEAKRAQKQQRLNSQAKLEVAKRGLLLERDNMLRQQKLKSIFGNHEGGPSAVTEHRFEEIHQQSSLLQQLGPTKAKSLARLKQPSQLDSGNVSKRGASLLTKNRRKGFKLVDLSGVEEDRERDSVRLALQKYTPLYRFLFESYTNKLESLRKQPPKGIAVNEKVIKVVELMKMYRDHNLDHGMLTKSEYQQLVTLINDKLLKPYDDDALNFTGFVQFSYQVAVFLHTQGRLKAPHETGGKPISQLLYGEMIVNLVTWFKLAARVKGFQTAVYEHPELSNDPMKARQLQLLNERIKQNPNLQLPPGFVVSKELQQEREYSVPPNTRKVIGDKKAIALELLDEIFNKSLGIRLIEAQISMKETTVVKLATQHKTNIESSQSSTQLASNRLTTSSVLSNYNNQDLRSSPANQLSAKKNLRLQALSTVKKNKAALRSIAAVSNVQSILENRDFDTEGPIDYYGLGESLENSSNKYRSESQPQLQTLDIYRTDSILAIVAENRFQQDSETQLLQRHRAGNSLIPVKQFNQFKTRSSSHARSVQALPTQLKLDRERRLQENLLIQTELSDNLKATTYEYQLAMNDGKDMEHVRQTALVLEDVLRVVTGDLQSYPFQKKHIIKNQTTFQTAGYELGGKRAVSLQIKSGKNVHVKQRLQPGEKKSNLQMKLEEERTKVEDLQKVNREKNDMERIKRSILLKKRIAESHSVSRDNLHMNDLFNGRAQSEKDRKVSDLLYSGQASADLNSALDSIKVLDPSLDKKKIAQMRAQQLKLSQAEREARQKRLEEDARFMTTKDKEQRRKAALEAKAKIDMGLAKRQEQYPQMTPEEREAALEAAKLKKAQIEKSVKRLAKAPAPKPQPPLPEQKPIGQQVKTAFKGKQKNQLDKLNRQRMDVYTKKERQEMLAFYLRPDVQTVYSEYEAHLGVIFDKVVGANDPDERDLKRMTLEGYISGFAKATDIAPQVLQSDDLELLYDTIVNERVDAGADLQDSLLANIAQSLSYEEFKKSIVRIASIVTVKADKKKMDPYEIQDEQQRLLDNSGGEAPAEWDELGNPVRYKTVVQLKRKEPNAKVEGKQTGRGAQEPTKLYDISKLRLEKFHHVLHYLYSHCKDKVINYAQPATIGHRTPVLADYDYEPRLVDDDGLDDGNEQVAPLNEDQNQYSFADPPGTRANDDVGYLLANNNEEEKLSPRPTTKTRAAMEMTLGGELDLNNSYGTRNDEIARAGGQINSDRQNNFRSSLGSQQRRNELASDGQFSEYNEILQSPKRTSKQ